MIKKTLSIFLAFACLFSSVANASGTSKIALPRPSTTRCKSDSYSYMKRISNQKAFLTGLLCATRTNVYVKLYPGPETKSCNFTITKIDNTDIEVKRHTDHLTQINALLYFLVNKKDVIDFEYDQHSNSILTSCMKINDYYLTQKVIQDIGEKILELILEKKKDSCKSHQGNILVNLTKDPSFQEKVTNIFEDILYNILSNTENSLNFYTFPSSSTNKLEPVQNFNHVNYIKNHPQESSLLEICYIKAFFMTMLHLAGTKITVSHYGTFFDHDLKFVDAFNLRTINCTINCPKKGTHPKYLTYLIKLVKTLLPPEKLKIETIALTCKIPVKITICNNIVLNEIDIFNLGQRFHNIAYYIMRDYRECKTYFSLSDLNRSYDLNQIFKQEFKNYTGVDLPDLK